MKFEIGESTVGSAIIPILSFIVAAATVLLIHVIVIGPIDMNNMKSDRRFFMSIEVVVLGLLFSGFVLDEIREVRSFQTEFWGDAVRLFGALVISIVIYKTVMKWK